MPRSGLRVSTTQMEGLSQEFQAARGSKDFDLTQRIQGLLLVCQGMAEREAARIVGVGRRTLQEWIFKYRHGGVTALYRRPRPGRSPKLTAPQFEELAQIIGQGPESVGLDTGVWTAPLIAVIVKKRFGVTYHPDHIRRILKRLGFSVQLPTRVLSRADPDEQSRWLDQELGALKKRSSRSVGSSCTKTRHRSAKPGRCTERGPREDREPR
jgi:transposase